MIACIAAACGGGDDAIDDGGSSISKDYINVTPNLELLADGQQAEIRISANCNWTVTKDADASWLSISPSTGSNTQSIAITAGKNATGASRMAILTIKGGNAPERKVTVTQAAADEASTPVSKQLTVSPAILEFEAGTSSATFQIASNTTWKITHPSWCNLSKQEGSDSETITVTVEANNSYEERTGQIILNGEDVDLKYVTIKQKAKVAIQLSASVSQLEFDYTAESKNFDVTSNTTWTINCPEWCSVSPASGSNSASVSVTVAENEKAEERTGQIVLTGNGASNVSISIVQKANTAPREPTEDDNQPPQ